MVFARAALVGLTGCVATARQSQGPGGGQYGGMQFGGGGGVLGGNLGGVSGAMNPNLGANLGMGLGGQFAGARSGVGGGVNAWPGAPRPAVPPGGGYGTLGAYNVQLQAQAAQVPVGPAVVVPGSTLGGLLLSVD